MTDEQQGSERLETAQEMAEATQVAKRTPFASAKRLERARELVRALAVAQTNSTLYPASHPLVSQSTDDLVTAVAGVMDLGFDSITVNVYKGTLFVEDHVLPEESVTYRKLIEELLARGISALTLDMAFNDKDAAAFVDLLASDTVRDIAGAQMFLEAKSAGGVRVSETTTLDESAMEGTPEKKAEARSAYDAGLSAMQDVETQVKLGKVFEIEPLQRLVNSLLNTLFTDPAAVLGLTAIKSHDDYTLNHSINVCILSLALGAQLGLDKDSLHSLGLSALLYDLGKVRIPEDILNKESPLTADEWAIIKSHATEGADLLKRIQLVDQMPMIVAYEHHQRHDLQGYPEPPQGGGEQHLFSKVVALCDAYDAMTTSRPFRRDIRPDKALAVLMQGRGKAYDPSLTKSMVAMLGIYPMGAVVRTDDGSVGCVYRVNRDDLLRPRVKVLMDASGRWLDEPQVLDLRVVDPETGSWAHSICECIPAGEAGIDDVWDYL